MFFFYENILPLIPFLHILLLALSLFQALVIPGEKHEVTYLIPSPDKLFLSVGYADGTVRVFELSTTDLVATFSGHRSAITCLAYDQLGHRLASGSKVGTVELIHSLWKSWNYQGISVERFARHAVIYFYMKMKIC